MIEFDLVYELQRIRDAVWEGERSGQITHDAAALLALMISNIIAETIEF